MSRTVRFVGLGLCFFAWNGALTAQVPQMSLPGQSLSPTNAQTLGSDAYQVKVKVTRIILDVVVTDAKGKPVEGLKQDDFKVLEDGAVQPVRSFDAHTAASSRRFASARSPSATKHLFQPRTGAAGQASHDSAVRHAQHATGGIAVRPRGFGQVHQGSEEFNQHRDLRAHRPAAHAAGFYR